MRKLNLTILVGLVLALLGAGLVAVYGNDVDRRVADGKETVMVLVAKELIPAGTRGGDLSELVEKRAVQRAYLTDQPLTDLTGLEDQVLLGPVPADGQLSRVVLGAPRAAEAVKPKDGNIALAVGVDLTPGVARYVVPGSSVDVFVTYADGPADAASTRRTKLFVSNVRVLSVSVAAAPDEGEEEDGSSITEDSASPATTQVIAVLDLTPVEAEQVVNATTLGKLYFGLTAVTGEGKEHKTPDGVVPNDVVGANK